MNVKIEESWRKRLQEEFDKPYFEQLVTFVKNEYRSAHVLPPGHQIFHIFNACPFEKVKEFPFLDHWPTYSKKYTKT